MGNADGLEGIWYSHVGSRLELKVSGSSLSGSFSSVDVPGKVLPVVGVVDADAARLNRALSFVISWIDNERGNKYRSVSSYTGQYHKSDDDEVIDTIFLLVDETIPAKQYASTLVGYDIFHRQQPAKI